MGPHSPFSFVLIVNTFLSDYVCELWVENGKLLGNLSLSTAISSYLHLCFSFDLKYPKVGDSQFKKGIKFSLLQGAETISDLIQHGFARYGKNTGQFLQCIILCVNICILMPFQGRELGRRQLQQRKRGTSTTLFSVGSLPSQSRSGDAEVLFVICRSGVRNSTHL